MVMTKHCLDLEETYREIGLRPGAAIVSPAEHGNAPPVLPPPLLCLEKGNHDPVVTIFAAGHFIPHQNFFVFIRHIAQAFESVKANAARMVLLGLEPLESDAVHGYIVPGAEIANGAGASLKSIELLAKRSIKETGRELVRSGGLWNTLVFVCKLKTLSNAYRHTELNFYRSVQAIADGINGSPKKPVIEQVYRSVRRIDFFKDVLQNLSCEDRRNVVVLSVPRSDFSSGAVSGSAACEINGVTRSPC